MKRIRIVAIIAFVLAIITAVIGYIQSQDPSLSGEKAMIKYIIAFVFAVNAMVLFKKSK